MNKSIYFSEQVHAAVTAHANKAGKSFNSVVNEALKAYLNIEPVTDERPAKAIKVSTEKEKPVKPSVNDAKQKALSRAERIQLFNRMK